MSKGHNVNEIAEMVGYSSSKVFRMNFEKQFGILPSEYIQNQMRHKG